jgi:hypothetical protein
MYPPRLVAIIGSNALVRCDSQPLNWFGDLVEILGPNTALQEDAASNHCEERPEPQ